MDEKSIFIEALQRDDPEERAAYITAACAGNPQLRSRIEALLQQHANAGDFLEKPAVDPMRLAATQSSLSDNEQPSTVIGPYKLLQKLGEGGMGVVFMAEQTEPIRRKVALKLIKPGMNSRQVIARFEAERQALAMMDHPNIARVLNAGITEEGSPYFAMELVRGLPITKYCDRERLSIAQRLQLFEDACRAVQHAHQKGVIHRDIKPSNVMVTQRDGLPVVKVIDFGLAKALQPELRLTDKTLFTEMGQVFGTLEYMSPEQAEMNELSLDTRTDVYSLGVLLYELLTGSTPLGRERIRKEAFHRVLELIVNEESPRPSRRLSDSGDAIHGISEQRKIEPRRLSGLLEGELDWIALKALEKDRERRYESASSLADDVRNYLGGEMVTARPPTTGYRLRKAFAKYKVAFTAGALFIVLLLAGLIGTGTMWLWADKAESLARREAINARTAEAETKLALNDAEDQRRTAKSESGRARSAEAEAQQNRYNSDMRLAHQDWKTGNVSRMIETLDVFSPKSGLSELRGWEWYYLSSLHLKDKDVFHPQIGPVSQVKWNPDGRLVAIEGKKGVVIYEPISQQIVHFLTGHRNVTWSPDGSRLAAVDNDQNERILRIVSTDNWEEFDAFRSQDRMSPLVWRADGRALAWGNVSQFSIWELGEKQAATYRYPTPIRYGIWAMAWGPKGRLLSIGASHPSLLAVWDCVEKKPYREFAPSRGVTHISWSPGGKRLAAANIFGNVTLWDVASGEPTIEMSGHGGQNSSCKWSPDGKRLVSGGEDNLVRIWSADNGQQLRSFSGHRSQVRDVDWSSRTDYIASGSNDGTVRFWRPSASQDFQLIPGRQTVAWSPDGTQLVSNNPRLKSGVITCSIRDVRTGQIVTDLDSKQDRSIHVFAWSPNGKMIAGVFIDGKAHIWDAATGRRIHSLGADSMAGRCVAWSPDNRQLATCGQDKLVRVWDASNGMLLQTLTGHAAALGSVCWSPDGRWFASADWGRDVIIRSADTWQIEWTIDQDPALVGPGAGGTYTIAWSPDSHQLASVTASGQVVVRTFLQGNKTQKVWSIEAHTSNIRSVAWSPTGNVSHQPVRTGLPSCGTHRQVVNS